jgi:predicted acyltransferase (DUF342 family)
MFLSYITAESIKAPRPINHQVTIVEPEIEDCTCNVLTVEERAYFLDDVTIEGTVKVGEKVKVGELTVYDDATIEHNLSVGNDLEVDDDLSVGDNATIDGNLTVDGTIDASSISVCDVSVDCSFITGPTATASIGTNLTIGDELSVIGDATVDNDLFVGNDASVGGDLTVDGALNVPIIVGTDLSLTGDLTVDGTIEASSISVCDVSVDCSFITGPTATASIETDLTIGNDLTVGNDVFVGNDVSVAGDVTVDGSIDVSTVAVCDLSVDCNLFMVDSTDADHGNILKDGSRFIHNFGINNTFVGENSGTFTFTGTNNTAFGASTLSATTFVLAPSGNDNTAVGYNALTANENGHRNVAIGSSSLASNTIGTNNVAVGFEAMRLNTFGQANIAIGDQALESVINTDANIAIGHRALQNSTGNGNIAIGDIAGIALTGSEFGNIYIGNTGTVGDNQVIRIGQAQTDTFLIGNLFVRGRIESAVEDLALESSTGTVSSTTIRDSNFGGDPVLIDAAGQLSAQGSSKRFKENIIALRELGITDELLEKILQLEVARFNYKQDEQKKQYFGLIAEEVEKILPELVRHDKEGRVNSVAYNDLFVLLIVVCQKLRDHINNLEATVQKQEAVLNDYQNANLLERMSQLEKTLRGGKE